VEFIEDAKFERAGIFEYSQEDGTRAAKIEEQVNESTRQRRWNDAMATIQARLEKHNEALVGKRLRVLVEEPGVARGEMDAPDIDTTVYVDKSLPVGEFVDVTISDWRGYDLVAD
jgi:ribosomal protein S12 methylthiotransferase